MLKCRDEVKNIENDNGHSFFNWSWRRSILDGPTIIFVCVEQFSVGAVRIALDSYENIGKKGNGRKTSCLLSISETRLYFFFLGKLYAPIYFFCIFSSKRFRSNKFFKLLLCLIWPSLFTFWFEIKRQKKKWKLSTENFPFLSAENFL